MESNAETGSQTKSLGDSVVVSGISCRLPESDNMQEFRDNLMNGVDMVTEDDRRWKPGLMGVPKRNGKLKDLAQFDAGFFGVHPKQATHMDPQLRMLLEISYEAIVDAGMNPEALRGSNTGVFIGAQSSESQTLWSDSGGEFHPGYVMTGSALAMFSNRLSFALDLRGPSSTIDTACSSGTYALNQALRSIREGVCDAAIVGGTNICLRPEVTNQFLRLGMLSPDGMCKSFDKEGNGYCRSDGVVAIFLQKGTSAKRIYCTLLHSKVNADGHKTQGITFPSGPSQKELLEATYSEAGVNPRDLAYIEAHGTGTPVGDPQECFAISEVLCKDRESPLLIGSVKSNMGHCESASGVASFAKLIVAMEEHVIPGNLHFKEPNEHIPSLKDGRLEVVKENKNWSGGIIGLNSFGFGGANAHVILKSNQKEKMDHEGCDKPRLFMYGSRTKEAAEHVIKMAQDHSINMDLHKLWNETAHLSLSTHPYRGFTILNGSETDIDVKKSSAEKRPVWYVFSGMGSQWPGMGKKMMDIDVFRNSILKLDVILKPYGVNLFDCIMSPDEETFKSIVNAFVCIIAIQVALVDMLSSIGIKPDGIVGHSLGEVGCGYADGCLTAEEAVLAAYWRGYFVQNASLPPSAMAAVGLSWQECLDQCPPGVAPACHNSESSVTVSGTADAVRGFVQELQDKGVFAKEVECSGVPFHSHFMKDIAPALAAALEKEVITPKPRSEKWISSSFPESEWSSEESKISSAYYYTHNLVSPVLFKDAMNHIPKNAVVIEFAPHCLLQNVLKESLGGKGCVVGLMKRKCPNNVEFCLTALGKCYQNGASFDPLKLFPPVEFPVPRGTPMISPNVKWDHSQPWPLPKLNLGNNLESKFEIDLTKNGEHRSFLDHKIDGRPVLPAAGYLVLVWKALANREGKVWDQMPVIFENVSIQRATILTPDDKFPIEVKFIPGSYDFQIIERDAVIVTGTATIPEEKLLNNYFKKDTEKNDNSDIPTDLVTADLYKNYRLKGFEYGPAFQVLLGSTIEGDRAMMKWTGDWVSFIDGCLQLPIIHLHDMYLPTRLTTVIIDPEQHQKRLHSLEGDIQGAELLFDPDAGTRKAGGIHLHGIKATLARRTEPKKARHEFFSFTPYSSDITLKSQDPTIVKYAQSCHAIAAEELKRIQNNGFTKTPTFSDKFIASSQTSVLSCSQVDNEQFSDTKRNSYLEMMQEISKVPHDDKYSETVSEITGKHREFLDFDLLLGNLLQDKHLRPFIDIISENTFTKTLKTVEVCTDRITKQIYNPLKSQPTLHTVYSVATEDPENFPQDPEKEVLQDIRKWDPSNIPETSDSVQLVIANNVIRKASNVKQTLQAMLNLMGNDGFLLVQEATTNFHIIASADSVFCDTGRSFEDLNDRSCSIYCDLIKWRHIFCENGFDIIHEISDNLLSSLFLLRRKRTNMVEKQTIVDINDMSCNWTETLKAKLKELDSKPKGENLWLKADTYISGILGIVNCLKREIGGEKLRCIFNMDQPQASLDNGTMESLVNRDVLNNVFKNGQWGSYRHVPLDSVQKYPSAHAHIDVQRRGDLSSLSWYQSPQGLYPMSSDYETTICKVNYASLNFRDIMLATGRLPPDAIPGDMAKKSDCLLGMEFSGTDSEGNRVMGLTPAKGLATTIETAKKLVWSVPDHWTMEEAATVPVVYTTAFYALVVRGNIQQGNSILIHSGSGGVGQAAISIALHYGCKVFTTVGSTEKREYLKERFPQLDDTCFFSSRDTEFELGILAATSGKGVDIVLNSLAEEKLQASVRVLADSGKFLEIGKYDLAKNSALGMSVFLKNIAFHGILMDNLFNASNVELQTVSKCFMEGIKSGIVVPLKATVFEKGDIEGAFRFMGGGKHIGKVLIKICDGSEAITVPALPRTLCDPMKTYIITGGLGGFGLELADWLVHRGARRLVLTSRSGIKNGYQRQKLKSLKDRGAEITVSTKNICDLEETQNMFDDIKDSPIGGVFHLAMVLNDGMIENQTQETFQKVCQPKITGTMNLDHVTRECCKDELDWFVVFSSIVSGYGNVGQSNYGFANSCMERIIEKRKLDGFPGLAIQWGPIGDVGVYMDMVGSNEMPLEGTLPQRLVSCFQSLDCLMSQSEPVVASYVMYEKNLGSQSSRANIVATVCNILGIKDPESIDENRPFSDLGIDSLLAVEVKITLENEYNVNLNANEIRTMTFKKLRALAEGAETIQGNEEEANMDIVNMFLTTDEDNPLLPTDAIKKLNDIKEGTPLFIVHHVFGTVFNMHHVVNQLRVPVYALQRTKDVPLDSLQSMATFYIKAIQEFTQGQNFHLGGYSWGACMAQEMALQLQERKTNPVSLILLDGSHRWVPATMEDPKKLTNETTDLEVMALNKVYDVLHIVYKDEEVTDEKIERTAVRLSTLKPEIAIEDARVLSSGVYHSLQLATHYKPGGQYHGDVTLIAAESSRLSLPGLGDDYGMKEFCTGEITMKVMPGKHVSFLLNEPGNEVASIINNIVSP